MATPRVTLLTIREAMEALSVSRRTIYRMIRDGQLDVVKLPPPKGGKQGATRIREESITRLVNAGQAKARRQFR